MYSILGDSGDAGLAAEAASPAALLQDLALGLYALSCGGQVSSCASREVSIKAASPEELAVRFLNELVFLMDTEGFVAAEIKAEASFAAPCTAAAVLKGETGAFARRKGVLVKAATYHGLELSEKNGSWKAKVMLDI